MLKVIVTFVQFPLALQHFGSAQHMLMQINVIGSLFAVARPRTQRTCRRDILILYHTFTVRFFVILLLKGFSLSHSFDFCFFFLTSRLSVYLFAVGDLRRNKSLRKQQRFGECLVCSSVYVPLFARRIFEIRMLVRSCFSG